MIRFRIISVGIISVGIISVGIIQGARFADLTGATRRLAPAAVGAALLAAACAPRSPSAACFLHSARTAPSG
jgi:hypothetical protein